MSLPQHIAIIMDGNGRWAQQHGYPRVYGHIKGSSRVRPIVRECGKIGVKFLTLFCFSTENWGRPTDEVSTLMKILKKYLVRERKTLMANSVRMRAIGDLGTLPQDVQRVLDDTIELTKNNTGLQLTFALSYGSRQEIRDAVKKISQRVVEGKLKPEEITDALVSDSLYTGDIPDPDLVIRTSHEFRISNFLLWQTAYSEFYFSRKLWPEFDLTELHLAISEFAKRNRRFGLTASQLEAPL